MPCLGVVELWIAHTCGHPVFEWLMHTILCVCVLYGHSLVQHA